MDSADDLDPKRLMGKAGRKRLYTVAQILDCLEDGMTTGKWEAAAYLATAVSSSTFAILKQRAIAEGHVVPKGKTWVRGAGSCSLHPGDR